jgi:NitT/TauT family transport system permease protein
MGTVASATFIIALFLFLAATRLGGGTLFALASLDGITRIQSLLAYCAGVMLLLALWLFASALVPDGPTRIPTPWATVSAGIDLVTSGRLPEEIAISFLRIVVGFTLAGLIGIAVGLILGTYSLPRASILPINSFLRYIPPTSFVVLLIVYFGIGERYKYAVVFVGTVFFIVQMVVDAVEDVDVRYVEMGLLSGLKRHRLLGRIILPCAWPKILDVLRINLSAAWTFLVAAEVVGASGGLGNLIVVSQRFLRIEDLYVGVLTFGIIGVFLDFVLQAISQLLFPWHYLRARSQN